MALQKGMEGVIDQLKLQVEQHLIQNNLEEIDINGKTRGLKQVISKTEKGLRITKPYIKIS
jgi:hypothetical protein